jgi:hypothetical protein
MISFTGECTDNDNRGLITSPPQFKLADDGQDILHPPLPFLRWRRCGRGRKIFILTRLTSYNSGVARMWESFQSHIRSLYASDLIAAGSVKRLPLMAAADSQTIRQVWRSDLHALFILLILLSFIL